MNRSDKIQALLPTVRSEGDDTFSVESLSLRGWRYTVTPRTDTSCATCECEDFRRQSLKHPTGYRCIHILAVRSHLKQALSITNDMDRLGARMARHQNDNYLLMMATGGPL